MSRNIESEQFWDSVGILIGFISFFVAIAYIGYMVSQQIKEKPEDTQV